MKHLNRLVDRSYTLIIGQVDDNGRLVRRNNEISLKGHVREDGSSRKQDYWFEMENKIRIRITAQGTYDRVRGLPNRQKILYMDRNDCTSIIQARKK
tara:strand:+ start:3945 stop:4235 length:291 start_codon:yes stop_codon:yes gene_type:complete